MTLSQIIRNLKKIIKDTSDDYQISDYQMIYIVNYIRDFLIRQDYEKGRSLSSNIIQGLKNVEFESVDKAESTVTEADENIFKSVLEIPKPIEVYNSDLITYVGGVNKTEPIQFTTSVRAYRDRWARHTSKLQRAYLRDSHMYIEGCEDWAKYNYIEGVFSNPVDVWVFNGETTWDDPDLDREYPMSGHMITTLNNLILNKELNLIKILPDDNLNNATKDGLLQQGKE